MSLTNLLRTLSMGCACTKESIRVEDRRFYVLSRLGEGGFSYVDLVEDSSNHKLFALKRIQCHSREDENIALKEVKYMKDLDHPNLVGCEVACKVPGEGGPRGLLSEVLIVMPFYRRGTVFDIVSAMKTRGDQLKEARLLTIFRGVCEGIRVLHTHKPQPIAHRDVKPHNVLLDEDDTPVLMDFGSMGEARQHIQSSSQARQLQDLAAERCSMPYRAPELFTVESDCQIDERVDIWSLGCTLYSLCYAESPFDAAYQRGDSIALAVLTTVKIPDTPQISQPLKDLIMSMLVITPADRPFIDRVISQTDSLINAAENRI